VNLPANPARLGLTRGTVTFIAIAAALAVAALVALFAIPEQGAGEADGPLRRAIREGGAFRVLPDADLALAVDNRAAVRALRVLLLSSPEVSQRLAGWMDEPLSRLGIDPGSVDRRSVVVRFGSAGSAEHATLLEGRFNPERVRTVMSDSGARGLDYGGDTLLVEGGRAVAVIDDKHVLVCSSEAMARASIDASAGRDPSAASMDAVSAIERRDATAVLAGRIPDGARLDELLPAFLTSSPFSGTSLLAALDTSDGVRLELDMTHPSPARAELSASRLQSDFVLDALALAGGRSVVGQLAPFTVLTCDRTRVAVSIALPRSSLLAGTVAEAGPGAAVDLPEDLLAPLPEIDVDESLLPSPERAADGLPPPPPVDTPGKEAPAPAVRHGESRPLIWSPSESSDQVTVADSHDGVTELLRTIAAAEARYRQTHGRYAGLAELAGAGLIAEGFADEPFAGDHRVRFESISDSDFLLVAEPADGSSAPALAVDASGVVRHLDGAQ